MWRLSEHHPSKQHRFSRFRRTHSFWSGSTSLFLKLKDPSRYICKKRRNNRRQGLSPGCIAGSLALVRSNDTLLILSKKDQKVAVLRLAAQVLCNTSTCRIWSFIGTIRDPNSAKPNEAFLSFWLDPHRLERQSPLVQKPYSDTLSSSMIWGTKRTSRHGDNLQGGADTFQLK